MAVQKAHSSDMDKVSGGVAEEYKNYTHEEKIERYKNWVADVDMARYEAEGPELAEQLFGDDWKKAVSGIKKTENMSYTD